MLAAGVARRWRDTGGGVGSAKCAWAMGLATALLFERELYTRIARYPWRAAAVVACVVLFVVAGAPVERWIMTNDGLHYWAPLLDPAKSTLKFAFR